MKHIFLFLVLAAITMPQQAFGAIGCTLSNPAADLKYLYPEMTTYKEELHEFPRMKNGAELFKGLRARLGSDLDPIYETFETPYTVYTAFRGQRKIGVVHGVNVPGKGGVIQVFLSLDVETAEIKSLFFQRLESPAARQLRSREFRAQFAGLTLADFYKSDYYVAMDPATKTGRVAAIQPPVIDASGKPDYDASLRGVRKNLVLLDFFVFGRRFEPFFERAGQASANAKDRKE